MKADEMDFTAVYMSVTLLSNFCQKMPHFENGFQLQVLKFQTFQKSIKAFPGYIKDASSNKLLFGCFQIGALKL